MEQANFMRGGGGRNTEEERDGNHAVTMTDRPARWMRMESVRMTRPATAGLTMVLCAGW